MYPDYECNNYPMSITDEDGPFLVMEAELSGDVELNDEFKKDASYRYSCATVSAAIDLCKSMTDGDADPWYESWEKAVERYPLEKCEDATTLYWIEPTDPHKALCAFHPHPDLERYVAEAIGAVDTYLLEREYCPFAVSHLDLKDVDVLLSAAWGLARVLKDIWGTCDPDVMEKIEDATYGAHITVRDLIAGEEAAKASAKSDDNFWPPR